MSPVLRRFVFNKLLCAGSALLPFRGTPAAASTASSYRCQTLTTCLVASSRYFDAFPADNTFVVYLQVAYFRTCLITTVVSPPLTGAAATNFKLSAPLCVVLPLVVCPSFEGGLHFNSNRRPLVPVFSLSLARGQTDRRELFRRASDF